MPVVRQSARGPRGLISPGALAVRVQLALAALKVVGIFAPDSRRGPTEQAGAVRGLPKRP